MASKKSEMADVGSGSVEAGVTPSDGDFNATRVGPASGVSADAKPKDVVSKAEGDEDEDHEDEESPEFEAGEDEEDSEKSLTAGDLQKSLDRLTALAREGDGPSRKDALLAQANSDTLSKSEREELFELLGGAASTADEPGDHIVKSMTENDTLQKALDVSEYLQEQHSELVKSLRNVGEEIQKSDNRRHEFNLVMARAIRDIGTMVKSLAEEMGTIGAQPARAPKSLGVKAGQVLQKSFAGRATESDELSKSQVLDALDGLMEDSMSKGGSGTLENGEDIALAVSKYEQTHMITKSMLGAAKSFIQKKNGHATH